MSVTRAKLIVYEVFYLNNGFSKAATFNQKVGRHLILLLSTISEAKETNENLWNSSRGTENFAIDNNNNNINNHLQRLKSRNY